jgi:hypothetical protein
MFMAEEPYLENNMENFGALSIKELRARCQSNAPEAGRDPLVGLSIRFFSIYITKYILVRLPITANQVTTVSVLVFLTGISLFIPHIYWLYFLGSFLVYLSVVLDGCDGEIARLKFPGNLAGGIYTEPVSHDIQHALLFVPLTLGEYFATGSILIVYVGFAGTIAKLLYRFFIIRFEQLQLREKMPEGGYRIEPGEQLIPYNANVSLPHKVYRWMNRNVFSSVGLVVPLFICGVFQRVDVFIWIFSSYYALLAVAHFTKQVLYISRMKKKEPTV